MKSLFIPIFFTLILSISFDSKACPVSGLVGNLPPVRTLSVVETTPEDPFDKKPEFTPTVTTQTCIFNEDEILISFEGLRMSGANRVLVSYVDKEGRVFSSIMPKLKRFGSHGGNFLSNHDPTEDVIVQIFRDAGDLIDATTIAKNEYDIFITIQVDVTGRQHVLTNRTFRASFN